MNDRFRFRAWSKEEKKYYYDAEQTYDCLTNGIMHDNFGGVLEDDKYIVEQCTGIKDKHGNLIFEGDLIWLVENGKLVHKGVVEWDNGNDTLSGAWLAVSTSPSGSRVTDSWLFTSNWGVYGNVHDKEKYLE